MTNYPLATLAATVSNAGISAPSYSDIYQSLQASFQGIYGSDSYIEDDSQDGQMLAVFAKGISDANFTAISVYNSFSPSTALSNALSSNVKINGIRRLSSSNSSVNVYIVGVAGTTINNGIVADVNNNKWDLPATVVIPSSGQITVTAVSEAVGAITAPFGTVNKIVTNVNGWQTVTNLIAAVPGAPVEIDPELRVRQSVSTSNSALGILDAIVGNVANITGVTQVKAFENDTQFTDSNGLPPHSIALVVEGGDVQTIGNTIALKKDPGCYTYGTTTVLTVDSVGVPNTINYFVPTLETILVNVTIKALAGYTNATGNQIIASIVNYINGEGIFANNGLLSLSSVLAAAYNTDAPATYNVNLSALQIGISPNSPANADLVIAFNQLPTCSPPNVNLTVM